MIFKTGHLTLVISICLQGVILSTDVLAADNWTALWNPTATDSNLTSGAIETPILVSDKDQGGRRLLWLQVQAPKDQVESALWIDEPDRPKIPVRKVGKKSFLIVEFAAGNIELTLAKNQKVKYAYSIRPHGSALKLASSCTTHNTEIEPITLEPTEFPALVDCKYKGEDLQTVIFSTTQDAEWYGAGLFESAGKGERFKEFSGKEILTRPKVNFSWGKPEQKNIARVNFVKLVQPPSSNTQDFHFRVGLNYLSGKFNNMGTSAQIGGLIVPLEVFYQRNKAWWLLGGGYRLFAYSTQPSDTGTNSSNDLAIWYGFVLEKTSFRSALILGYSSTSLDFPTIGTTSSLDAPFAGLDLSFGQKRFFGLQGRFAQTSNKGTYTRTEGGAYFQFSAFGGKTIRVEGTSTQISATERGVTIGAQWISAGLTLQF